jgi:predicted RNase H-like HicB family nuclease
MLNNYTLEYWKDDGWYVGKLKEIPGVFSQGESLNELVMNIKEVYQLMLEDDEPNNFKEKKTMLIEEECF